MADPSPTIRIWLCNGCLSVVTEWEPGEPCGAWRADGGECDGVPAEYVACPTSRVTDVIPCDADAAAAIVIPAPDSWKPEWEIPAPEDPA